MTRARYITVTTLTAVAFVVFIATLARATLLPAQEEMSTTTPPAISATAAPGDFPDRIHIPSLSINAAVQETGITKSGAMGVPTNFTDVAWYKFGPVPGQLGSAVIDGHVDNGLSLAGIFKHLGDIKVGDNVYIETKDGKELHFVVKEVESYPYKEVPTNRIFTQADRPRLNLITCEGNWVKADKTYDQRLVIYTELVS